MKVFIIIGQSGQYEDRYKEIEYVSTNEEESYLKVETIKKYEMIYFEIWENGTLLSSYTRDFISSDGLGRGNYFTKWERFVGKVNERLENANIHS